MLLLSALSLVVARSGSCARAFRFETEARALTLLKEWLSPKQRACYERFRYFDVIGSDTGTRYRIHHGTQTNIEELGITGHQVCKWCFVPDGDLVAGDVMLAQKIALETNERGALSVAHRSFVSSGPRQVLTGGAFALYRGRPAPRVKGHQGFCCRILPSIFGSSAVDVDLSVPARRASSTVSRSAASGCIRPRMSDILRGAIWEAMS